ncbi:MAG TPA: hypothetical protein VK632_03575, partial [Verrucomicrobiae bacterium]|nr:hypothetical protein [Verrucomicrobiae bacterium]
RTIPISVTPDSYMDQYRAGPDSIGGCYMRLFWHPVYRSEDLKCGWAKPRYGFACQPFAFSSA